MTNEFNPEQAITDFKVFVNQRFADNDRALQIALTGADKAVITANVANEKRLDSVNEFRAQQADLIASFLTRSEYQLAHNSLDEKTTSANIRNAERIQEVDRRITAQISALELRLGSRLDLKQGGEEQRKSSIGQTIAIISLVILSLGVVASIVLALTYHG